MNVNMRSATAVALFIGLPAGTAVSQAQPSDEPVATLETITVTATKREQSLLEVPSAITAVDPEQAEDLRLTDARDLLQLAPSTFLQENNAGTARDISIRGVSTPTLFAEPGVSMYIDDVYSSGYISYPTQFRDMERVEILRGPQGALYGRNAVGGAVNVISARPTDELSGEVTATAASLDRYELEGILNVPLGDKAAVRALAWHDDQSEGEYFNETTGQYLDTSESTGGRLTGLFEPTEALSITAIIEAEDADGPGTYLFFPDAGETEDTIQRDTQPTNSWESMRYSVQATHESGMGTFTLVIGGRDYELDGVEDTDLSTSTTVDLLTGALGAQVTTRYNKVESQSAEARWLSPELGPVTLLAGVTYLDESAQGDILTDLQSLSNVLAGGLVPFTLDIANDQSLESISAFAELTWTLNDRVDLIASGRYTSDDKNVDFLFTPSAMLVGLVGPSQSAKVSKTFENFSPGVTLTYDATETLNTYAKVQTGFRAGGFNFNVANAANLEYDEETSINYEIGAKQAIFDGRGYLGASAYFLQQDDVLVPVTDVTAPPGLQGYLINAGEAETLGLELEGSMQVTDELNIQATLGLLDAEFTSGTYTNALGQPVSLDGNQIPSSRDWTGSFVASYRKPVRPGLEFLANGSYSARADGYQDTANSLTIGDSELLNLSTGFETDHFQVLAFVQNATDDQYDIAFGGFRPPNAVGVTRAQGRTYGVTVKAGF